MTSRTEPWAIYRRPGRYVVKRFIESEPGLWAVLGNEYDREKAQNLADTLTADLPVRKRTVTPNGPIENLYGDQILDNSFDAIPVIWLSIEEARALAQEGPSEAPGAIQGPVKPVDQP